ncbi:hypothetical protein FKM82_026059 [Ascaphus truei]
MFLMVSHRFVSARLHTGRSRSRLSGAREVLRHRRGNDSWPSSRRNLRNISQWLSPASLWPMHCHGQRPPGKSACIGVARHRQRTAGLWRASRPEQKSSSGEG